MKKLNKLSLLLVIFIANFLNAEIIEYTNLIEFRESTNKAGLCISNRKGFIDLYGPNDFCLDDDGNFYITDTFNHNIKCYSKNGELLSTFGFKGRGKGLFQYPFLITVDASNRLYIADENSLILKYGKDIFGKNGYFIDRIRINEKFKNLMSDLWIDKNNRLNIYFNTDEGIIYQYDLNSAFYSRFNYNNRILINNKNDNKKFQIKEYNILSQAQDMNSAIFTSGNNNEFLNVIDYSNQNIRRIKMPGRILSACFSNNQIYFSWIEKDESFIISKLFTSNYKEGFNEF